ncbi:hypothetical protein [Nitrososphaeria virus YSH_1032793]|uniref:Uncharacterized protein n=1 Tax=Nitrososphaeria virus YSH_1032793 TaxID=3071320 RepID=A0A976YEZ1_9CAUD|nr:hypothetical protein QKV91_gp42 [Yangshan Harbor Nitrososphaeria virus]UVF62246.1 hypothetical protein [Nitrososphaeria virus YSH_1032793]
MAMILAFPLWVTVFSINDVIQSTIPEPTIVINITSSTATQLTPDNYSDRQVRGYWFCSDYYGGNYDTEYFCNT